MIFFPSQSTFPKLIFGLKSSYFPKIIGRGCRIPWPDSKVMDVEWRTQRERWFKTLMNTVTGCTKHS